MKNLKDKYFALAIVTSMSTSLYANIDTNIRIGYVKDVDSNISSAIGINLEYEKSLNKNLKVVTALSTTSHIDNYNKATKFQLLDENQKDYMILSKGYLQYDDNITKAQIGRLEYDTPFLNSDDVGMIPNRYSGIDIQNKTINNINLQFSAFNKWSGVDSNTPSKFASMQDSHNYIKVYGLKYSGIKNLDTSFFYYDFDDINYQYTDFLYKFDFLNITAQYSKQSSNNIYGIMLDTKYNNFTFTTAYNSVDGTVSNGFGGGPYFTSCEDHTVSSDQLDQSALLGSISYNIDNLTISAKNVNFDIGENESDYTLNYKVNNELVLDIIYYDMNDDGDMTRAYLNYSF